jgi:hypothetical protein
METDETGPRQLVSHEEAIVGLFTEHPEIDHIEVSAMGIHICIASFAEGEELKKIDVISSNTAREGYELTIIPWQIVRGEQATLKFWGVQLYTKGQIDFPQYLPDAPKRIIGAVQVASDILEHWRALTPADRIRIAQINQVGNYSGATGKVLNLMSQLLHRDRIMRFHPSSR